MIITPEFRLSFPQVLNPKLNDLNGKMEYSCVALFPKGANLSAMHAEVERVAVEKWGADKKKWPKPLKSPFRDQGEKAKEGVLPSGHEEGAVFMTLRATQRPGVVDSNVQPIIDAEKVYGGCYAIAAVNAYAYSQKGNSGVAFGLEHIQITRDGETFSGRVPVEQAFKPVAGKTAGALFG